MVNFNKIVGMVPIKKENVIKEQTKIEIKYAYNTLSKDDFKISFIFLHANLLMFP